MDLVNRVVKHCLTENDGESYDVVRIGFALGVLVFLALAIRNVFVSNIPFDYQSFGIGFAGIIGAGGTAIGFKSKTETKAEVIGESSVSR